MLLPETLVKKKHLIVLFRMFFKLNSFYKQFTQISLRLISKKLISATGPSLQFSTLTNSPLKRGNNRISGFISIRPTPFGIVTIDRIEPKLKYSKTSTTFKKVKVSDQNESENVQKIEKYEKSIDLMFPFLTGEELKAFDSSVYE